MISWWEVLKASKGLPVSDFYAAMWGKQIAGKYTITELEGPLPLTFNADGTALIDYRIYGNTEQTGTPTPENPIMPNGCGERTENLVESIEQGIWTMTGFVKTDANTRCRIGNIIGVIAEQSYTIHCETTGSTQGLVNIQYKNDSGTSIGESGWKNFGTSGNYTATIPSGTTKITIILTLSPGNVDCSPLDFSNIMLNSGSTAKPYEPYGYKLPILSNSTVTDIYLGEVETTRRIKKLVLTGEEDWVLNNNRMMFIFKNTSAVSYETLACTHYVGVKSFNEVYNTTNSTAVTDRGIYINIGSTDVSDFKSYLAAQYAAGTPVTVWYVLAEPETGILNEPLMKIGDYADTISMEQAGVSIPTTAGSTTLDVETTIKPSNVYIKYKS